MNQLGLVQPVDSFGQCGACPNFCVNGSEFIQSRIGIVHFWLMRLGRTVPELEAGLVFELDEWRAAFILNKKPVPKKMPTLNEVLRLIAQRGGFLSRKGDGEPGAKTLWLGLQEVAIFF